MNANNDDRNTISIKSWLNEKIDPPHVIALIIAMLPTIGLLLYASRRVFINAYHAMVEWALHAFHAVMGWILSPHNSLLSATLSTLYIVCAVAFCYSIYALIRKRMSRKSIGIWAVFDMAFPFIGLALYKSGMFAALSTLFDTPILFIIISAAIIIETAWLCRFILVD